jgi:DNA-binding response OmpR family regulator
MGADRRGSAAAEVVVVDDDPALLILLAEVFAGGGFQVTSFCSGEEALVAARARRPAAVILDVVLPGVSGYEICRELRDLHGPGLPIIFVSGERAESYDRVAGLLIGADDYLAKPFAPDELLARVRALLRRTDFTHDHWSLTPRELEVLQLLTDGRMQGEIAERLTISPKTVSRHIEHIHAKLGVSSRAQAVAVAFRDRLVEV